MCAWAFGDSFDLYAAVADATSGYWDSGGVVGTLIAGRFSGSQAMSYISNAASPYFVKSSGQNDAVHHIIIAYRQTAAISGATMGLYFQLSDAATNQVCINFRTDGVILLTSATPGGTVLATYNGAVTAQNTWFAFEFEVIINNTTGRFRARKNGNTVDDFDSGATLNTRPGVNAYANKLTVGMLSLVNALHIDDLLWRSDAAAVPFVGDIRCYTRMPASDASVQFTRLGGATNTSQVSEAHQDGLTTYVFDSTVGHADFYNIAAIGSTPASVIAVTTRGFMQKSDAGARTGAVQIKSGGTTVASPTLALTTGFLWAWRTDVTNPATGTAWTAGAVDSVTIGPVTVT
jgi:hypothetical protein